MKTYLLNLMAFLMFLADCAAGETPEYQTLPDELTINQVYKLRVYAESGWKLTKTEAMDEAEKKAKAGMDACIYDLFGNMMQGQSSVKCQFYQSCKANDQTNIFCHSPTTVTSSILPGDQGTSNPNWLQNAYQVGNVKYKAGANAYSDVACIRAGGNCPAGLNAEVLE